MGEYNIIVGDNYEPPEAIGATRASQVFAPVGARLAVLLAPGDALGPHPLRSYLWPTLDINDKLDLEADETVFDEQRASPPSELTHAVNGTAFMTSHRLAFTGELRLPTSVRSDYHIGLGLVSPTLMEGVAAFKALGRVGQNKDRHWVRHIRYEWLTDVTCFTTTRAKKKLVGGTHPPTTSTLIKGQLRSSTGKVYNLDLAHFEDADAVEQGEAFLARLGESCVDLGLSWSPTEPLTREVANATERKAVWTIDERAAYTVPAAVISAAQL